jgi:LysM repeat protein
MFKTLVRASAVGIILAVAPLLATTGPTQAQSACGSSVSVRAGDTLNRIAARCGVSLAQILRANPQISNPNVIYIGQTIRLTGAAAAPGRPSVPSGGSTYRVRAGDTLAAIARRHGVSLARIIAANPRINPNLIFVGQIIVIPGGTRPLPPIEPEPRPPVDVTLTVTGRITNEGVECLAMRDDRGRLYTLVGNVRRLAPGDRVEVRGTPVRFSICQQGRTLEVLRARVLAPGDDDDGRFVRVRGVLTGEGVECQAMRGDDGRLYTFSRIRGYGPGDYVEVRGTIAEFSFCMQGTTINVQDIIAY